MSKGGEGLVAGQKIDQEQKPHPLAKSATGWGNHL